MGINHTPGPWIVYGAPGNVWAPFDQENVANAYIADRDRETQSANARLIAAAPAMLSALRKISQGADCFTFNSDADAFRFVDMVAEAVAPILSRIDGAPTAQPAGVWRIVSGEPDTPRALYWSNCDGWGGIAGSDAFSQAERETLNLPIGGRWWFDSDDEPAAPSGEAARDMPISEATRAALVGYAEDSDMWNAPSPEMVAQLLDLAGIERRPPSNVFTAFCQEADGTGTIWIQQVKAETIADATAAARRDCAEDWGFNVEQVHCLGLALGDCQIVHWEDAAP
ncbi:MAG: hypothetical protein IPG83_02540 [Novosphingobium sp.]|nr:hypothetical protein [Novosphingobium sp.]